MTIRYLLALAVVCVAVTVSDEQFTAITSDKELAPASGAATIARHPTSGTSNDRPPVVNSDESIRVAEEGAGLIEPLQRQAELASDALGNHSASLADPRPVLLLAGPEPTVLLNSRQVAALVGVFLTLAAVATTRFLTRAPFLVRVIPKGFFRM